MFNGIAITFRKIDWYVSKYILRKKVILRKVLDHMMYLDLIIPGISKALAYSRVREADMTQIIKENVREGMVVLDIGSNIGYYPLLEASLIKDTGRLFAVEPDPRNYNLLVKSVEINPYNNVIETFDIAISNKVSEELMMIVTESNLNKLTSNDDKNFIERNTIDESINIKVTTVDEFVKQKNVKLDFLRMDIEGSEVEVFQGMPETLEFAKPGFMILLELHPQYYSESHSLARELKKLFEMGYGTKIIISAGEARPQKFIDLNYSPNREILSDGYVRGWYEDIKPDDVIPLTCCEPKVSRYLLLIKR